MVTRLVSRCLVFNQPPSQRLKSCPETQWPMMHFPDGSHPFCLSIRFQSVLDFSLFCSAWVRKPLFWTLISANGNSVLPVTQAKTLESSLTPVPSPHTADPLSNSWFYIKICPESDSLVWATLISSLDSGTSFLSGLLAFVLFPF